VASQRLGEAIGLVALVHGGRRHPSYRCRHRLQQIDQGLAQPIRPHPAAVPAHQHPQLRKPSLPRRQARHQFKLADRPTRIQALRAPDPDEMALAFRREQPFAAQALELTVAELEPAGHQRPAQLRQRKHRRGIGCAHDPPD